MKKVTILSLHLGYGGVEKAITNLANMLCNNYNVEIISIYNLYNKSIYDINEKVTVKYLINSNLPLKVEEYKLLFKRLQFIKLIKSLYNNYFKKMHLIEFFKDSINGILMYKKRKKEMKKALKKIHSDYVISTKTYLNKWLSQEKIKTIKIGWEHNHHHNNMKYAKKVINSAKNLDYLVLVSKNLNQFYKEKLKKYKCKTLYIPNVLKEIPKSKSSLKKKNLITVGRLSIEKGYLDLLKIFNNIKEKCDWNLDIVGDGDERKNLEKFIRENNLEKRVTLHGYKNSNDVNKLMQNASIYIMTSYTESFGIVLLEAMSNKLPCLAFSSAEGAREIISNNIDGFLIKNRNFKSMESHILKLINDYNLRLKMGKKGLEKSKLFLKENIINYWLELLK